MIKLEREEIDRIICIIGIGSINRLVKMYAKLFHLLIIWLFLIINGCVINYDILLFFPYILNPTQLIQTCIHSILNNLLLVLIFNC